MSCKYHFNWTTDTPCPYCRITELEQQIKYEQERNANNVSMAEIRIAELEQALEQIANQAVEPAHCYEIADRWHRIARKALGRG